MSVKLIRRLINCILFLMQQAYFQTILLKGSRNPLVHSIGYYTVDSIFQYFSDIIPVTFYTHKSRFILDFDFLI